MKRNDTPGIGHLSSFPLLQRAVLRAAGWLFSLRMLIRTMEAGKTVVLARILAPGDFGLFGLAFLLLTALDIVTRTGFHQALIHRRENDRGFFDTAWTAGAVRGVVIAVVLYASAAPLARFFDAGPSGAALFRVVGLSAVLSGLMNPAVVLLEKELRFREYFRLYAVGAFVEIGVSVAAVCLARSVWGLLAGVLAGDAVRSVLSYRVDPYRPSFRFDLRAARELFRYGRWILGSDVLVFLIVQGDSLLTGKLLGAAALGIYRISSQAANLPVTELVHVLSRALFPVYAHLRDNRALLKKQFLRTLRLIAVAGFPAAGFVFVFIPDLVRLLLGDRWAAAVPVTRVLAVAAVVRALSAATGPLFKGAGRASVDTFWQGVRLALLLGLGVPLARARGVEGMATAVLASLLVAGTGALASALRLTGASVRGMFPVAGMPFLNAAAASLVMYGVRHHAALPAPAAIPAAVAAGAGTYLVLTAAQYRRLIRFVRLRRAASAGRAAGAAEEVSA